MKKRLLIWMTVMSVVVLAGCGSTEKKVDNADDTQAASVETTQQIEDTQSADTESQDEATVSDILVIPTADLSETVQFYPVELDGVSMEVMAAKDANGTIRLAYNTCQVCYSSGRGYYKQEGDKLVCQNCGNQFTIDQIGESGGGCNPIPISSSDYTQTDDEIQIPYTYLSNYESAFSNWK